MFPTLTAFVPTAHEFSDARYDFEARYGADDEGTGLVLDCPEPPRLSDTDLAALHGGNHDQAPGDPEDMHVISEPDAAYQARIAALERLDREREYDLEQAELTRHNREVGGWAVP